MHKTILFLMALFFGAATLHAQLPKVYDEHINPMAQIDDAVSKAKESGRHVMCQVGGNWCPWCLRLADFVKKDSEINKEMEANYVYIHVNYPRRDEVPGLLDRLGYPGRFGYPVMVIFDGDGHRLHIQDTSYLEDGETYDPERLMRFIKGWTPTAVSIK